MEGFQDLKEGDKVMLVKDCIKKCKIKPKAEMIKKIKTWEDLKTVFTIVKVSKSALYSHNIYNLQIEESKPLDQAFYREMLVLVD